MPKTYSIVGMNFKKAEDFVAALAPGTPVLLVREPHNPVDPLAIAVWIEGRHVGYIPKKQNQVLAQFIEQKGEPWTRPGSLAMDGDIQSSIRATFVRSPNSGYPMVEVV